MENNIGLSLQVKLSGAYSKRKPNLSQECTAQTHTWPSEILSS